MKSVINFVKDSYTEVMTQVTWLSYKELQTSGILVLVASLVIAFVIGLVDISFKTIMEKFYQSIN